MQQKKIKIVLILLMAFLLFEVSSSFAAESFNNNLLKTELHKSPIGGLKVTLFTGKPYSDAITVNKKNDNEYVILLPETSNSSTEKPSLKNVSDVVTAIEVKTQQFQNNVKGYTKIVIKTNKPIEIVPQAQVVNPVSVKLTENEYKELLSQASKKQQVAASGAKPVIQNNQQKNAKVLPSKTNVKNLKGDNLLANKSKIIDNVVEKVKAKKQPEIVKHSQDKKEPLQLTKEVKTVVKPKNKLVLDKIEVVEPKKVADTIVSSEKMESDPVVVQPLPEQKISEPTNQGNLIKLGRSSLSTLISYVKNNFYGAIAIFVSVFLLMLLIARSMTKGMQKSRKNFTANLNDKPDVAVDYTERIDDDMSWKEKFEATIDSNSGSSLESEFLNTDEFADISDNIGKEQTDVIENIEELFSDESFSEVLDETDSTSTFDDFLGSQMDDNFGVVTSVDDLFLDDVSEENNPEVVLEPFDSEPDLYTSVEDNNYNQNIEENCTEIIEEKSEHELEIVKSEFIVDENKAFYLVDFEESTAFVGRINDEFFVLKKFDEKVLAPVSARFSEKTSGGATYMTRVGRFRAVVEVTEDNMKLLIEL